ncbi:hypothetical protein CYLTODRAFT_455172 [Cylindrobasidium torrendii FP15055 ss-10]|uniref:Uncharacterized protein n=1 Tax=Cylindrobasidium torrendii FP15055 ss-10 TaxID=1314674 RepID=A0A0D7B8Q6_9AGAR|nr:hypothetical protein CYLTODRAFT_455172 [Cylindrobasidium torrendii FP15055 ss-10]
MDLPVLQAPCATQIGDRQGSAPPIGHFADSIHPQASLPLPLPPPPKIFTDFWSLMTVLFDLLQAFVPRAVTNNTSNMVDHLALLLLFQLHQHQPQHGQHQGDIFSVVLYLNKRRSSNWTIPQWREWISGKWLPGHRLDASHYTPEYWVRTYREILRAAPKHTQFLVDAIFSSASIVNYPPATTPKQSRQSAHHQFGPSIDIDAELDYPSVPISGLCASRSSHPAMVSHQQQEHSCTPQQSSVRGSPSQNDQNDTAQDWDSNVPANPTKPRLQEGGVEVIVLEEAQTEPQPRLVRSTASPVAGPSRPKRSRKRSAEEALEPQAKRQRPKPPTKIPIELNKQEKRKKRSTSKQTSPASCGAETPAQSPQSAPPAATATGSLKRRREEDDGEREQKKKKNLAATPPMPIASSSGTVHHNDPETSTSYAAPSSSVIPITAVDPPDDDNDIHTLHDDATREEVSKPDGETFNFLVDWHDPRVQSYVNNVWMSLNNALPPA